MRLSDSRGVSDDVVRQIERMGSIARDWERARLKGEPMGGSEDVERLDTCVRRPRYVLGGERTGEDVGGLGGEA